MALCQGRYTPLYPHTHAVSSTSLCPTTSTYVSACSWLTTLLLVCTGQRAAHFSNRPEVVKVDSENQNPEEVL